MVITGRKKTILDTADQTETVPAPPLGTNRIVTRYKLVNMDTVSVLPTTFIKDTSKQARKEGLEETNLYPDIAIDAGGMRDDHGPGPVAVLVGPNESMTEEPAAVPTTKNPFVLAIWIDEAEIL